MTNNVYLIGIICFIAGFVSGIIVLVGTLAVAKMKPQRNGTILQGKRGKDRSDRQSHGIKGRIVTPEEIAEFRTPEYVQFEKHLAEYDKTRENRQRFSKLDLSEPEQAAE